MLVAELQELEEVKGLVTKGHTEGVIAFGEVASALSEVDVDEGDIEELAWAGIAVTAEAATLGVRLVSRAIDAARRAAERG